MTPKSQVKKEKYKSCFDSQIIAKWTRENGDLEDILSTDLACELCTFRKQMHRLQYQC